MAKKRLSKEEQDAIQRHKRRTRLVWAGVLVALLVAIELGGTSLISDLWPFHSGADQSITNTNAPLASFFAPEVLRWREDIREWAKTYDVNPNVVAIVIQIESCGDPLAVSSAGALGLMQVMPFHFSNGENMIDPDVNVRRGITVFYECLAQFADWDLGLALACYNGGPGVTLRDSDTWPAETQAYYEWATGLWDDVVHNRDESSTLTRWLESGGSLLCNSAALTPLSSTMQPAE